MPVSGTRRLMAGGWGNPKLDLKDPSLVLYLPLWYPDSETTGSTIVSKDRNRLSATVTGAIWGYQGRTFDGINDYISITDGSALDFTTGNCTFMFWIKPAAWAAANRIWLKGDTLNAGISIWAGATNIDFGTYNGTGHDTYATHGMSLGSWYCFAVTKTGTTGAWFKNGKSLSLTKQNTVNPSSASAYATLIGTDTLANNRFWWDGTKGEIVAYNRVLSDARIMQNFLATKWRYQ